MGNLRTTHLQEVHTPKGDYLRYKGRDGNYHFLDKKEIPESDACGVTWAKLREMRDNALLEPGDLYRITDYQCTTTQEGTRSAGHQFDIVVLALSEDTLSEEAWAMPHAGDTYFSAAKLHAWKLMYCLDNDKERFAWADDAESPAVEDEEGFGTNVWFIRDESKDGNGFFAWADGSEVVYSKSLNLKIGDTLYIKEGNEMIDDGNRVSKIKGFGRGVIYRIIDEWGNDCPYDFKNIQFKRWKVTAADDDGFVFSDNNPHYFGIYDTEHEKLIAPNGVNAEIEDVNEWRWCYTFDGYITDKGEQYDFSTRRNKATEDAMEYAIEEYEGVLLEDICSGNVIESYDKAPVGGGCTMQKKRLGNNVFFATSYCHYIEEDDYWDYAFAETWGNTLGQGANLNTLGNGAYLNTLGDGAYLNTFGPSVSSNTLETWANRNTFWQGANRNTLGQGAYLNTFGKGAYLNNLGKEAYSNTLGNGAYGNILGRMAYSNTLGLLACRNTLGQWASGNTLGQNCNGIVFGSYVINVAVSKAYCRYIRVEAGVENVNITTNATTSISQYLQNIIVGMGVKGTSSNRKTITHATVNDAKQTTYVPTNSTTVNV